MSLTCQFGRIRSFVYRLKLRLHFCHLALFLVEENDRNSQDDAGRDDHPNCVARDPPNISHQPVHAELRKRDKNVKHDRENCSGVNATATGLPGIPTNHQEINSIRLTLEFEIHFDQLK